MNYWLVKSEGECYSIDDLKKEKRTAWTGVRNFQARNFIRDGMKAHDLVLFYHSSGSPKAPTGVYGIAEVVGAPYEDKTAKDPKDEHYEPKGSWVCTDIAFKEKFAVPVTLEEIKRDSAFGGMLLTQRGQRLSVMPVSKKHFDRICEISKIK